MNLSPRLDEPLLLSVKTARYRIQRLNGKDGALILVLRMKVRAVVLPANFRVHSDHNSIETRYFRHAVRSIGTEYS